MNFFADVESRRAATGGALCVGLDPDPAWLPVACTGRDDADRSARFCIEVARACAPHAAAFKINLSFFEAFGARGYAALEDVLAALPGGVPTIADGKRGDIGSTAERCAQGLFGVWGFGAATVNPYLGIEALEPFLAHAGRGLYVLARTSNPGAGEFQEPLGLDRAVIEGCARRDPAGTALGCVVGATRPDALEALRALAPEREFLVPGVGAQGGDAAQTLAAGGARSLVNVSRAILKASAGEDFAEAAGQAAARWRQALAISTIREVSPR